MRRARSAGIARAVTLTAWLAMLAVLIAPTERRPAAPELEAKLTAGSGARFSIKGSVTGLFPGTAKALPLRVTNPNAFAIKVTKLVTRVMADAGRPACDGTFIRITSLRRPIVIRKKASRVANLTITMLPSAPDACQGATFRLRFTGKAMKR